MITLTLSWFGYHASIRRNKLLFDNVGGLARFQIDVFLILIYGVMLLNYERFGEVLYLAAVTFALFMIWDMLKTVEHGGPWGSQVTKWGMYRLNYRRELVTLIWTVFTVVAASIYYLILPSVVLWCVILIGISLAYRAHKIRPWKSLEAKLGVREW